MDPHVSPLERAFALARSGRFRTTSELKQALKAEGYGTDTLTGATLLRQLRGIIQENHVAPVPPLP